jgi:hypothetical protein
MCTLERRFARIERSSPLAQLAVKQRGLNAEHAEDMCYFRSLLMSPRSPPFNDNCGGYVPVSVRECIAEPGISCIQVRLSLPSAKITLRYTAPLEGHQGLRAIPDYSAAP